MFSYEIIFIDLFTDLTRFETVAFCERKSLKDVAKYVKKTFPEDKTTVWLGAVDPEINAHSYIVPGLGDAGDLAFGIKE